MKMVLVRNVHGLEGAVEPRDIRFGRVKIGAWVTLAAPAQYGGGGISATPSAMWYRSHWRAIWLNMWSLFSWLGGMISKKKPELQPQQFEDKDGQGLNVGDTVRCSRFILRTCGGTVGLTESGYLKVVAPDGQEAVVFRPDKDLTLVPRQ